MSSIGAKQPPLRLDPDSYETLRQQVLRRDRVAVPIVRRNVEP